MSDFPQVQLSVTFSARAPTPPPAPRFDAAAFVDQFPDVITKDQIRAVHDVIRKYPAVELPTKHYLSGGMYCREGVVPGGTLAIGKAHKTDHFFMVLKGRLSIWSDTGRTDIVAPCVLVCPAGTQRLVYAHEDTTLANVHRTDKTNVEEIEADLVEYDPTSSYGPGNMIIKDQLTLEHTDVRT